MMGPGKYDKHAQVLLEELKAKGVVLLVIDGVQGHGMSVKATPEVMAHLPDLLIMTANEVREAVRQDLAAITRQFTSGSEFQKAQVSGIKLRMAEELKAQQKPDQPLGFQP